MYYDAEEGRQEDVRNQVSKSGPEIRTIKQWKANGENLTGQRLHSMDLG